MIDKSNVRISEHYGYQRFEQNIKGWIGSGFNHAHYQLEARRVIIADRNETQIQFTATEFKGTSDRMYEMSGSLVLTPQQAEQLARAIYPEGFKETI